MDEIRFQTELGDDQTIRIPDTAAIPPGVVEVTVRKSSEASVSPPTDPLVSPKNFSSVWEWLYAVGRQAETWDVDLPSDMAENHDYYAHGTPRE
jgi:hypothetical protein